MPNTLPGLASLIQENLHPITGASSDYDPLIQLIGDARFVLIGEASHGTHEFYRERAQITKRLIKERGFTAVAVEADWPNAYRVNRYVRGTTSDTEAIDSLEGFKRFPTWMWRNTDVLDFIGWLRAHNDALEDHANKVGFMASIFTACVLLLKLCLATSPRLILRQQNVPAVATPASIISVRTLRPMAMRRVLELADQFDALLHLIGHEPLSRLERTPEWKMEEIGEPAETFPWGL